MGLKTVSRTISGAADYEVGTWTPVLEGSLVPGIQTYANQGGRYVRFGDLVWATGVIALSAFDLATSGAMLISGLPFPGSLGSHNSSAFSIGRAQYVNLDTATGYSYPTLTLPGEVDYLALVQFGDDLPDKSVLAEDIANNTAIRMTGTYVTGVAGIGP